MFQSQDTASNLIIEHSSPSALRDAVEPIMEQAASILGRVKAKGKAEGCVMDSETEKQVRKGLPAQGPAYIYIYE